MKPMQKMRLVRLNIGKNINTQVFYLERTLGGKFHGFKKGIR